MNWLKILLLLPMVLRLISVVESIVSGARQGQVKKDLVMSFIGQLITMLVSYGVIRQEEVSEVLKVFDQLIDVVVELLNSLGAFKHSG